MFETPPLPLCQQSSSAMPDSISVVIRTYPDDHVDVDIHSLSVFGICSDPELSVVIRILGIWVYPDLSVIIRLSISKLAPIPVVKTP